MAIIETDRLYWRPFSNGDIDTMVELFADERVAHWVGDGSALSETQAQQWLRNAHQSLEENGTSAGAIIERASDQMIGWAGIVHPKDQKPELIYGLEFSAWGKGYGLEAATAIVDDARKNQSFEQIIATVDPENTGSIKILKKLGFHLIDSGVDEDGLPTDTYLLEMSR